MMDGIDMNNTTSREDKRIFEDYSMLETLDYWPHQVVLVTLYSLIAFISFLLNLITIVVLVKCDKICSELYVYLINLSITDIVMSLLCIPFTYTNFILNRWIFPHFLCPVVNFAQVCSVFVSIWTLSVISIDRYFAIINPLSKQSKCFTINCNGRWQQRKKMLSIVFIWLAGIGSGYVQIVYTRVVPFHYGDRTLYDCRENLSVSHAKLYTVYIFISMFGLPFFILIYVYSIIGYQVWRHVVPGNAHQIRDRNNNLTREKVIKILILIVVLFFICWFPLQIFNLLVEFEDNFLRIGSTRDYDFFVYGYLVVHILAMSHSFVNPIVYCFMSRNFWLHFCNLTRNCCYRMTNFNQYRWRTTIVSAENKTIEAVRERSQRTGHSSLSIFKKKPLVMSGMSLKPMNLTSMVNDTCNNQQNTIYPSSRQCQAKGNLIELHEISSA